MNDLFVSVIPEPTTPYEMVFDRIHPAAHVPWAMYEHEQASGWWNAPQNEFHSTEEYYRWMITNHTFSPEGFDEIYMFMTCEKFFSFYANNRLTEHYWDVFRNLTEDEDENEYNTQDVPVIENRWEIASGWFDHTDRHEPNPIAMECKDQIWREIYLFTAHYETMCYVADQF